jgi:hypothetical protein
VLLLQPLVQLLGRGHARALLRGALWGSSAPLPVSLAGGDSLPWRLDLCRPVGPAGIFASTVHRHVGQISPNKNMRCGCATAAFTLPSDTTGFVIWC